MPEHNDNDESFEETLRSMAREAGRSIERALDNLDFDSMANMTGVDPNQARDWVESAGSWLRSRAEDLGDEMASHVSHPAPAARPSGPTPSSRDEALFSAGPHPLDVPTTEQGLALAALDSGRWTVEPGADTLAGGEGPAPTGALGVVRELRARDWITGDGQITLVGHHALTRWLESADRQGGGRDRR